MANGRKANGKWVDRWREGGRHRQRTFDRRGDRARAETRRDSPTRGWMCLPEFIEDYWRLPHCCR